jgi:DNA-binding IclR family transcriptional regulator
MYNLWKFVKKNRNVMARLSVETKDKSRLVLREQDSTLIITTSKTQKTVMQYPSDAGCGYSKCHDKNQ